MTTITRTGFRLLAGCCLALLVAAGGGTAFAQNCWHGRCTSSGGGPFGTGPVHGPGSSHDPIVQHPVLGPGANLHPVATAGPVVRDHRQPPPRPQSGRTENCQHNWYAPACANQVRDHRRPHPHGPSRLEYCRNHWNAPGCAEEVRDHRT